MVWLDLNFAEPKSTGIWGIYRQSQFGHYEPRISAWDSSLSLLHIVYRIAKTLLVAASYCRRKFERTLLLPMLGCYHRAFQLTILSNSRQPSIH